MKKKKKSLKTICIILLSILVFSLGFSFVSSLKTDKQEAVVDFSSYVSAANIEGGQDGAIYNGYLFSFGSSGNCTVYNIEKGYTRLSTFTLDKNSIISPHSNSVCFGSYYYDKKDEFPLMYSNIYNNYSSLPGVVNVYRIIRSDTSFSSELVQVIKIGFTSDATKWASGVRPYGNFVVDVDNNDLWAFVMDDLSNKTKFFKFDLPKINAGIYSADYECNVVTLEYSDIKEKFSTDYFRYLQGCCYYDGKIYSAEGFTNDKVNIPTIRVIDLSKKKLVKTIDLVATHSLSVEPEFLYVYNNKLYYKDVSGSLILFNIKQEQ